MHFEMTRAPVELWNDGIAVTYSGPVSNVYSELYPPPAKDCAEAVRWRDHPLWRFKWSAHLDVTAAFQHRLLGGGRSIVHKRLRYKLDVWPPANQTFAEKVMKDDVAAFTAALASIDVWNVRTDKFVFSKFHIEATANPEKNSTETPEDWRKLNDVLTLIRAPVGRPLFARVM